MTEPNTNESENLTRARLVDNTYSEELGCTKRDLREIVDTMLDIMSTALLQEMISIPFASLRVMGKLKSTRQT